MANVKRPKFLIVCVNFLPHSCRRCGSRMLSIPRISKKTARAMEVRCGSSPNFRMHTSIFRRREPNGCRHVVVAEISRCNFNGQMNLVIDVQTWHDCQFFPSQNSHFSGLRKTSWNASERTTSPTTRLAELRKSLSVLGSCFGRDLQNPKRRRGSFVPH